MYTLKIKTVYIHIGCRDVKKMTGDWFYDQRNNRFSQAPGHDLVKLSLKKKLARKYSKRK